jgi:hypothetical protein
MLYLRYADADPDCGHTVHVFRASTGITVAASHVVIENLTLTHWAHQGIHVAGAAGVTVRRCRFYLAGVAWGGALEFSSVRYCRVRDCSLCRCMNGIMLSETGQTEINHATIYRTRAHGIIMYQAADTHIRNSILFAGGRSGAALYVGEGADSGLNTDCNCYLDYDSATTVHWQPQSRAFPTFWDYRRTFPERDRHSFSTDPQFRSVALGAEDLRLRPDSPCRCRADDGRDLGADFEAGGGPVRP